MSFSFAVDVLSFAHISIPAMIISSKDNDVITVNLHNTGRDGPSDVSMLGPTLRHRWAWNVRQARMSETSNCES